MKKLVSLLLTGALACGLLAGCGGNAASTPAPADTTAPVDTAETNPLDGTVLKVGATPAPHAEILEVVKDLLAQQGITLEIVEFNDYIQPNLAVEDGSLDANYFQHITYMNEFNESDGTHLVSVADVHYEPFGIYAGKTASLEELQDGAQIGVPNDPTNGGRALLLLHRRPGRRRPDRRAQRHHQRGPRPAAAGAGGAHHPQGGRRHHRHQGRHRGEPQEPGHR